MGGRPYPTSTSVRYPTGVRLGFFLVVSLGLLAIGCSESSRPDDGGTTEGGVDTGLDAGVDAAIDTAIDAGEFCECRSGAHQDNIYLISDDGEVWTFNPGSGEYAFVVGPVCTGAIPYSMAVDTEGVAWINIIDSMSVLNLNLLDPGACTESPYVRTNPDFGLFGMSFASNSEFDFCSDLYVMTYSGDGSFDEGPDLGKLGVIDPDTGDIRELANTNFDGGELTGTGDGRLFGFAGDDPVKLVEYDRETGALLDTIELVGVQKTNASAVAFFAGDIWIFIEALPEGCDECLEAECGTALSACRADEVCNEHLECVLATPVFSDECGGGLSAEMMSCLTECTACTAPGRARVSRVIRFDLDNSDGGGFMDLAEQAPIRVVGAASSPCVPTEPF